MYVNCCATNENGIAPGGMVAIILPFYSPLVPPPIVAQPNPSKGQPIAQFIDWWQGGGINLFSAPTSSGSPPAALLAYWNDQVPPIDPLSPRPPLQQAVTPNRNAPTCSGVANGVPVSCKLHFFASTASIGNWAPQQLIEWTLGA